MREAVCVLVALVVSAGLVVAQEAAPSVESVRDAPRRESVAPPEVTRIWVDPHSAVIERRRDRLSEERLTTAILFEEKAVSDALAIIERDYGIVMRLDVISLDELGLCADDPVSLRAPEDTPLDTVLHLMLDPLDLECIATSAGLLVTTKEAAYTRLKVAIYPVRDLLLGGSYDSLVDLIVTSAAPETWADNGGGEAEVRPFPQRGALVVTQTMSVHEQIADLLAALRQLPIDSEAKPFVKTPPTGGCFCGEQHPCNQP